MRHALVRVMNPETTACTPHTSQVPARPQRPSRHHGEDDSAENEGIQHKHIARFWVERGATWGDSVTKEQEPPAEEDYLTL